MAATVESLVSYGTDSDSDNETKSNASPENVDPDALAHLQPLKSGKTMSLALLNSAPEVAVKVSELARQSSWLLIKLANVR
jgi:hypothetical protein